jgi:hypothetical protein
MNSFFIMSSKIRVYFKLSGSCIMSQPNIQGMHKSNPHSNHECPCLVLLVQIPIWRVKTEELKQIK